MYLTMEYESYTNYCSRHVGLVNRLILLPMDHAIGVCVRVTAKMSGVLDLDADGCVSPA